MHKKLYLKNQQLQLTLDTLTACRARLEFPDRESRLRAFSVQKELFFRHFHGLSKEDQEAQLKTILASLHSSACSSP